jgi:hypothetical protein
MAGSVKAEVCRLFRDVYSDHTVKHFHEQLVKRHNYRLGYTVTKLTLHAAGLVKPAARRGAHRKKRPRRPLPGMLVFQDGSRFAWLPDVDREFDLIVTIDDATSEIYSAFLVDECQGSPDFPQPWSFRFPHPVEKSCRRVSGRARP